MTMESRLLWETPVGTTVTTIHVQGRSVFVAAAGCNTQEPGEACIHAQCTIFRLDGDSGTMTMKYLGAPYRTKAIRCENGTVTALGGAREMVKWELEGNGLASNRLVFGASKEIDGKKSGGTTHQVPHDDKSRAVASGPPRAVGKEFVLSGFRGVREGYVFMSGSLGQGYYRGDIAGSYATSSQPNYVEPQSCHAATFLGRDFAAFGSLGQSDTVATVWNVRDQKLAWQLDGHRDGVTCLAASADGSIIATGSYDKTVRVWAMDTGEELMTLHAHRAGVRAMGMLPRGDRLLTSGADGEVRDWDLELRLCRRGLEGMHEEPTFPIAMAICPSGEHMVTGSNTVFAPSSVIVRDVRTGKATCFVQHFGEGSKGDVTAVEFMAFNGMDGRILLTGGTDGVIRAWELKPEEKKTRGMRRGFL